LMTKTRLRPYRLAVVGRIFLQQEISAEQFGTFATISGNNGHSPGLFWQLVDAPPSKCLFDHVKSYGFIKIL
jgi:hypothetical protein